MSTPLLPLAVPPIQVRIPTAYAQITIKTHVVSALGRLCEQFRQINGSRY